MKFNEVKKAKAEKAWELAKQLVDSMEFHNLSALNNFKNVSKEERSMVIFLTGAVRDTSITSKATCLLIFYQYQNSILKQIFELADNVIVSSVEGQIRFTIGFMDVVL